MKRRREYPITIARFFDLQGGLYGTIDLIAKNEHHVELQLGGDYVRLTRHQAKELQDALQAFRDLECDDDDDQHRDSERHHESSREGGIGRAIKEIAGEVAEAIGVRPTESESFVRPLPWPSQTPLKLASGVARAARTRTSSRSAERAPDPYSSSQQSASRVEAALLA